MKCDCCGSKNTDVPEVDIGVGTQQCGPATCMDCGACQDYDGIWHDARQEAALDHLADVEDLPPFSQF